MPFISTFASFLLTHIPMITSNSPLSQYAISNTLPAANALACPVDSPLSCHNITTAPDSCCFIYPGGQLLSTQFWDTDPAIGPSDSWTLHGLWPDLCDGSYPQYCNSAPTYYNISSIIAASSPTLLEFMHKYWLPNRGSAEHFWQHEWNKHGTCVNTLAPSCYSGNYEPGDEVVDFFQKAVDLFKSLDTYKALASAGIVPSHRKTYTAAEIQNAINKSIGASVVLGCQRHELTQAWYSFNVKGSLQTGKFVPTAPMGKSGRGNCPVSGIRYLPKM